MPKSICVSDAVLLKAEKTNKLSSKFCPSPLLVVHKTGNEVTVRRDDGVELKQNSALVKRYHKQESASVSFASKGALCPTSGCDGDKQ